MKWQTVVLLGGLMTAAFTGNTALRHRTNGAFRGAVLFQPQKNGALEFFFRSGALKLNLLVEKSPGSWFRTQGYAVDAEVERHRNTVSAFLIGAAEERIPVQILQTIGADGKTLDVVYTIESDQAPRYRKILLRGTLEGAFFQSMKLQKNGADLDFGTQKDGKVVSGSLKEKNLRISFLEKSSGKEVLVLLPPQECELELKPIFQPDGKTPKAVSFQMEFTGRSVFSLKFEMTE